MLKHSACAKVLLIPLRSNLLKQPSPVKVPPESGLQLLELDAYCVGCIKKRLFLAPGSLERQSDTEQHCSLQREQIFTWALLSVLDMATGPEGNLALTEESMGILGSHLIWCVHIQLEIWTWSLAWAITPLRNGSSPCFICCPSTWGLELVCDNTMKCQI